MMKRFFLIALLAATATAARITPADRAKAVTASDPQISPDGKSIVCVVSRVNLKDDRYETELTLIDVASGTPRPLTFERRGIASPRWSSDGERIAFLANASSDRDAKRQIWTVSMRGGDPRRLTDAKQGVQQFAWSPDGSQIAFVSADDPATNEDKNNRAFEIVDDDFLTREAVMPSHLWVIGASGGNARRVTSGAWSLPIAHPPGPAPSPLSWSPDGKTIAITKRDNSHAKTPNISRVVLVDVATGAARRLTTHNLDETQPVFSPDGSRIAYWHPQGGVRESQNSIWIAPASGGDGKEVTGSIDRNVFRAIWMPDGKSFLTGGHDSTTTAYWIVPADGGSARRLDLGDVEPFWGFWIDASVAPNGTIAFTGTTPMRPRELYVLDSTSSKPRRLTDFNRELAVLELGRVETIRWQNEGMQQDGVLIYPPGYDASKKYPLVLYIHGGPRASSTTGFALIPQEFAANDWLVFQPNYRGSDNLGNKYTTAISNDSGAGPGRDVMAGVEEVKKRASVDTDRIAVGGWSYGGYMTSWMIGHYPVFKAAVSGAAVNNLVDQYVLGDGGLGRRFTWGSPFTGDNLKKYIDQSPITYASKIKAPTLIMSDTGDVRVPITQSFEMYRALSDNGVPVQFIAFPVSGHSPEDPVHQAEISKRYIDWFKKYLK
jgi:dipeptidyl aminopeptidase/acylaminoacyl peptidase